MRAAHGLAERLRRDSRSRCRQLPPRPGRRDGARRPPLPAGDDGARDELGDAHGLGDRPRRPVHRPLAPRGASARTVTGARRPTTTRSTCSLRTVKCVQGSAEMHLDCEPAFDYGGLRPSGAYAGSGYHAATAVSEGMDARAARSSTDLRLGFEGPRARARTMLREGDVAFVASRLVEAPAAGDLRGGLRAPGAHGALLAGVAQARHLPRPPLAHLPAAQRADAQGPDLRADGRDDRRRHDVAAGDPGWGAQLGLPLQLDPRLDVHALGASTRSASTGRRTTSSTSSPTWPRTKRPGCRSCTASAARASSTEQTLDHLSGYDGARPVRIGNGAYDQNQHDVWGAVLDSVYLHTKSRDQLAERIWPILKRQVEAALEHWREPDRGHLGGARRAQALHVVEDDVLGRRRPRRAPRATRDEDLALAERWQKAADEIHADICENARRRAAASSPSTTTPTRSTPRSC